MGSLGISWLSVRWWICFQLHRIWRLFVCWRNLKFNKRNEQLKAIVSHSLLTTAFNVLNILLPNPICLICFQICSMGFIFDVYGNICVSMVFPEIFKFFDLFHSVLLMKFSLNYSFFNFYQFNLKRLQVYFKIIKIHFHLHQLPYRQVLSIFYPQESAPSYVHSS